MKKITNQDAIKYLNGVCTIDEWGRLIISPNTASLYTGVLRRPEGQYNETAIFALRVAGLLSKSTDGILFQVNNSTRLGDFEFFIVKKILGVERDIFEREQTWFFEFDQENSLTDELYKVATIVKFFIEGCQHGDFFIKSHKEFFLFSIEDTQVGFMTNSKYLNTLAYQIGDFQGIELLDWQWE
jgi:hypothetical protein